MLSKEEKLRYGEILRQQMKEKEERKKQQEMMKRGSLPPPLSIPRIQSDRIFLADPNPSYNIDPKELLQKKLQTQDYNPFGRGGGGAPNPKHQQNVTVNAEGNYSGIPMNIQQQYKQRQVPQPMYNGQGYMPMQQNMSGKYPIGTNQSYEIPNNGYRPPQQQPVYQKQTIDYQQRPQYQDYPPSQSQIPKPPLQYQLEPNRGIPEQARFKQPPTFHQAPFSQPTDPRLDLMPPQGQRMRTLQNEEMQQMYRRGGRNLLKLQNETVNEHLVKQKQKLQMQAFLKQQMEEAQHRKQMQKQKLKREQMQEERRNREYIQMQNQKLRNDELKKIQQKQKVDDQNQRNLAKRKQLQQEAKAKLERERQMQIDNERKRQQQARQQQERERDRDRVQPSRQRDRGAKSKISRQQPSDSLSSTSSEHTTQGKGFNTEISRQFFRKERQRQPQKFRNDKKFEMFTNQIQKMRDQISNQGQMFQKEIQRIKKEAENAQIQKKNAMLQIQKLKLELQKKNRQAEQKLFEALKRNDPYQYPQVQDYRQPYQQEYDSLMQLERTQMQRQPMQRQQVYVPPTPPKMPKTNKIQEQYESRPFQEQPPQKIAPKSSKRSLVDPQYEQRRFDESEVMTLDADSKKIPINLQTNSKLTMSKIEHYGKESSYYHQSRPIAKPFRQEPIIEQMDESRLKSRKSQRPMDELDRFVGSREGKRWEMSTVKDDITKEIEELLKKKETKGESNKMSEVGRHILSRGGLPYEGDINTLNSNRVSAVSNGTLDIDKVHNRNQARLRELKALGVETINTNNDEDLNRLNELLKHYP